MKEKVVLEVKNLAKHFPLERALFFRQRQKVQAVNSVSFNLFQGKTLGLVGESGCGKSTVCRLLVRLIEPTSGTVIYKGKNILDYNVREMLAVRRDIQMIFQDPYASLDPRMTVTDIVGEALDIHLLAQGAARIRRIGELLETVGLDPESAHRFPHEFSSGQRQRIGIARSLAVGPKIIICDEPISSLDVSIQAQIVNLLQELQDRHGLTYLFVAHDLSMVKHLSHHIAVMYLGQIVELTDSLTLYENPLHPYTQALLSAIPIPDPDAEAQRQRIVLQGKVPSSVELPSGCYFQSRCPRSQDVCVQSKPELSELRNGHWAACHFAV
ncbi:MAG TPA: oligopeptide/dipeptide ABC transporter ATP-binding protein [Desulfitobacteriaceae bacterium]|nr:oligopeptide/dipeptide ABC transporter ATP-binding protein [Desulfitobacteriaceae bacterium]